VFCLIAALLLSFQRAKQRTRQFLCECALLSPLRFFVWFLRASLFLRSQFLIIRAASLVLWIVRVGFYFQDLLGVTLAVGGDEENKLISVQL
jgi:hypothetical protein